MIDRWRRRIGEVVAKRPVPELPDSEVIPASHLRKDDVFDFAGATLRATSITSIGTLLEVEAVGPFNHTTLHFLPFEEMTVFLPRAEVRA